MTWVPRRWLRLPRRTIRLRLTVLYSGVFLLSGAALLGITYALVSNHQPQLIFAGPVTKGAPGGCAVAHPPLLPFDPTNISGCIAYGQSVANAQRASVLRQLLVESAVALGIMTVASLGLGWLVAGRVLRPLRTITAAARSI